MDGVQVWLHPINHCSNGDSCPRAWTAETGSTCRLERFSKLRAILLEVARDVDILRLKAIPAGHEQPLFINKDLVVEQKVQIPIFNSYLEWVPMSCDEVKYLIAIATDTQKEANVGDSFREVWFLCVSECSDHVFQKLLNRFGRLGAIRTDFDQTYKLSKELGKGGYGVVYKAQLIAVSDADDTHNMLPSERLVESSSTESRLERIVAVKIFKANCEQIRKAVWLEVRNLSLCNGHPFVNGLVGAFAERYIESGELKWSWRLATEHCSLGDLFDLVQRQAPMNVDRGLGIMSAVFAALDYVHGRRLVHRDVKAENVFIGKGGIPVLGDFGIAACLDDPEELAKPSGTPGYAAPEIILAKPYGQKVDIFACGVMFYFMLSKMMPFTGNDILTVVRKTAACKVKFSHATFGNVKNSVLFMLKALLEREEERRPSACEAFRGTQFLLGDNQDKVITEALEVWRLKQQETEREQEKKLKPIESKGALPTQDSVPTCCKKTSTMASRKSEVIPSETDEHSHVASKKTDEASQKTSTFASRLRQRVSRGIFFKGADEIAGTPRSSTSAVTHSSTGPGQRSVRSKVSSVSSLSEDMLPPPPDNPPALLPIHPPATPKADGHRLLSTPRRSSFLSFLRSS